MRNIRFTTLAKILIPLFLLCAVIILISFINYNSAHLEEDRIISDVIEQYGIKMDRQTVEKLENVSAQSNVMFITLLWVVGISMLIALASLVIVYYKLSPIRKTLDTATKASQGDIDENAKKIPGDELGTLTKELAYKIRADSLYKEELNASVLKANAASKAKSDFLSNMSHEIRTPMNAIIGMTNIAMSTMNSERKEYALKRIWDASNHLLGIINDILDMSKIEADKLELNPVEFVFEDLLKRVVSINNFRIVEKYQKFAVYIDEDIPQKLICDDQRLIQVITNLISNAVKFTPENGEITLDAKLIDNKDDMCVIEFTVSDTGVGISEEQLSRLFVPFEQAESNTTRKYGGTGLGLAISKRIVEFMGGKISVTSTPGIGSAFSFTFDAAVSYDVKGSKALSDYNIAENTHALIIDDDADMREYFVDIAMRFSIQCSTAVNGEEAMDLLEKQNKFDICFVDWQMPGQSGIELSRHIKKVCGEDTIIVMISSYDMYGIMEEAKAAGVTKFLTKPIFPSAFIECINSCFGIDLLNAREDENTEIADRFWGYRALLVEDVEINREIVIALFEPTLLEVDCAENGEEAVRMFAENPERYNIIFMDIQMPVMDGYDATRAIRALDNEIAKTIPVIAMTANVFRDDVDACINAGMNDHIGKPLDFNAVLRILRQYLFNQIPAKDRRKSDRRKNKNDRRQKEDRRKGDRRQGI